MWICCRGRERIDEHAGMQRQGAKRNVCVGMQEGDKERENERSIYVYRERERETCITSGCMCASEQMTQQIPKNMCMDGGHRTNAPIGCRNCMQHLNVHEVHGLACAIAYERAIG